MQLEIPENIEELIAAYLKQQVKNLPPGSNAVMIAVDISVLNKTIRGSVYDPESLLCGYGEDIKSAVNNHAKALADHDPIKERLAQIRKLQDEVLALEAGGAK